MLRKSKIKHHYYINLLDLVTSILLKKYLCKFINIMIRPMITTIIVNYKQWDRLFFENVKLNQDSTFTANKINPLVDIHS